MTDLETAQKVLDLAMNDVVQRARQFNTPIIGWKNNKAIFLTPDETEKELADNRQPPTENKNLTWPKRRRH